MPSLIWTDHAIDRVAERIGFRSDLEIPERQLLRSGMSVKNGTTFRQRIGPVIYIYQRDGNVVVVITVVRADQEYNRYNQNESNRSRKSKRVCPGGRGYRYEDSD